MNIQLQSLFPSIPVQCLLVYFWLQLSFELKKGVSGEFVAVETSEF